MGKSVEIRCEHCGAWFPNRIGFDVDEDLDTATLLGVQTDCPECGRWTGCKKENMRIRNSDGGSRGEST